MRVLYVSSWIDTPTGLLVEQATLRADFSAAILCDRSRNPDEFSERIARDDFRSRGKIDFTAIRELRGRIVDGQFDVVHAQSSRLLANVMAATYGLDRAPLVCGFVGHIGRYSRWSAVHRLTYLHPRLAAVSCNCDAAAEPLARSGVPREKLFTIYAGQPFRQRPTPPDLGVRRELGIPEGALVVGFAGNMRPVKGADLLLKAAIELASNASIHWLLAGRIEDQQVARLAEHPAIRGRVHALGWRDDMERVMTAMDVFAMPSRSEGFSRAIMEAMELGLCPVATRVGGTPELVRDGVDGLVTRPGDAAALAAAIRRLAADGSLRRRLAASARERIRTEFTMERMVDQTLSMYRTLMARRGAGRRSAAA
jgi:glycosyltransferase involved in cell wall biosynthesis